MKQQSTKEKLAQVNAKIQRPSRHHISLFLLLGATLLAPHAWADPWDLGGVFYELDNDLQEPANVQSSLAMPLLPAPISFYCSSGLSGLSCTDNRHLKYQCSDYGASGQYCKRQDSKVWIHCFPRYFHGYHCTVISNTSGRHH